MLQVEENKECQQYNISKYAVSRNVNQNLCIYIIYSNKMVYSLQYVNVSVSSNIYFSKWKTHNKALMI